MTEEKTLYLVDGTYLLFRAYHSLPPSMAVFGEPYRRSRPGLSEILREGAGTAREPERIADAALAWLEDPAKDRLPTNAVRGLTSVLVKLVRELRPAYVGVAFDLPGRVHRNDHYDGFVAQHPEHAERLTGYKADRPEMPAELRVQLPFARVVCSRALGIPVLEAPSYEADDLIGTLARRARRAGFSVRLVTADKDLFQLVEDGIAVLNPHRPDAKGPAGYLLMDARVVEKDFGVPPDKVVDILALVGDTSDNIPGVPGIGEKGARDLIARFGSVEGALEAAREEGTITRAAYRKGLVEFAALALLSKELATIRDDVPDAIDLEQMKSSPPDPVAARRVFALLAFESFLRDLLGPGGGEIERAPGRADAGLTGGDPDQGEGEGAPLQGSFGFAPAASPPGGTAERSVDLDGPRRPAPGRSAQPGGVGRGVAAAGPSAGAMRGEAVGAAGAAKPFPEEWPAGGAQPASAGTAARIDTGPSEDESCAVVAGIEDLGSLLPAAFAADRVVFTVAADASASASASARALARRSGIAGLALAWEPQRAVYVPLARRDEGDCAPGGRAPGGHAPGGPEPGGPDEILRALAPLVESRERPKTGHDVKSVIEALVRAGLKPAGFDFDTMIAAFLLQPDRSTYGLPALAKEYLGEAGPGVVNGAGAVPAEKDARQRTFDDVDAGRAAREAGREARVTLRLAEVLSRELAAHGLAELFATIDMPLVEVLVAMETTGVRIDLPLLDRLSREMGAAIDTLRAGIHALAGHEFNVDSPTQLARVLFEEIGLKPVSRTAKSGASSTRDEDLEALAARHPLAGRVREYRTLAKLRSTYVDALPQMVDPATGRVHTTFHSTGAATGRLSSSDPNLQNIPVRGAEGRKIRAAFVPEPGWTLISADYSQVELRVMAHMTGDPDLIEAFRRGEDIHRTTAARIWGVPYDAVTADQRRAAKTINFGILYGMGPMRLARELAIPQGEAKAMIASYFGRFPRIRSWIDGTIEQAERQGHVATLFGRIRHFPDLVSTSRGSRQMAVRQAVNSRIQGTAADLMKMAMIRLDRALGEGGLAARLLIQVHDELVLEAPPAELPAVKEAIRQAMENVHPLDVPLTVDVSSGPNWLEAKP